MKKKKDAALDYMLKLGIFPAKTPSGALEQLRTVMDPETLKREAVRWEMTHGGISGRTAQQFIDYLLCGEV